MTGARRSTGQPIWPANPHTIAPNTHTIVPNPHTIAPNQPIPSARARAFAARASFRFCRRFRRPFVGIASFFFTAQAPAHQTGINRTTTERCDAEQSPFSRSPLLSRPRTIADRAHGENRATVALFVLDHAAFGKKTKFSVKKLNY